MHHDVGMIRVMEAFFAAPDEGERLEAEGRSYRLLGELPDLEVVDAVFEPGWEGVDPHVHDDHTDSFYVLEGEVEFLVNGEWRRGGPGSFFSAPPGVEHGFRIAGEHSIRVLNVHAPNVRFAAGMRLLASTAEPDPPTTLLASAPSKNLGTPPGIRKAPASPPPAARSDAGVTTASDGRSGRLHATGEATRT